MTKSISKRTTSKAVKETAVVASLGDRIKNLNPEDFATKKAYRDAACQILRELLPWAEQVSINRKYQIKIILSTTEYAAMREFLGIPVDESVFDSAA